MRYWFTIVNTVKLLGLLALLATLGCNPGKDAGPDDSSGKTDPPTDATTSEPAAGQPKLTRGGVAPAEDDTLMLYYSSDPDTLNLVTASDNVSDAFHRRVYEFLARRTFADPMKWEPQLAEKWEFDEDQLEYTIHLRKGVFWHPLKLPNGKELDAREFTSKDVKFTFDCLLNEHVEAADKRSYYLDPEEEDPEKKIKIQVSVADKYTVKVKWRKPYFMADDFTLMMQILPRHVYSVDENGEPISFDFGSKEFADGFNNHWANTKMCGTGPMILESYERNKEAVFVRNPNYWGNPYYFSRVVYRHITNPNTAQQQLLQNDLDWGGIPEIEQYIQSKDHPNVKAGKVNLKEFRRTAYRYMGYNLQKKVFQDRKVRLAISHAVPVDGIIQKIYHGLATRMTGPFLPGGPFSNPNIEPIPLDLDKARALLDEAGWKDTNSNGIRDKMIDGQLVEFEFDTMIFSDSPQYLTIAELIKENCRQIGLDMHISPTKWALFLQKLNKKEFDTMILGWVSDWKSDPFQLWHSSQADLQDSSNFGYKNPEVDKLIEELRVTMNEDRQKEIYHELHRLIFEDQPYTFLYSEMSTGAMHSRIENVNFYPMFRPHIDAREWTTKSARKLGT